MKRSTIITGALLFMLAVGLVVMFDKGDANKGQAGTSQVPSVSEWAGQEFPAIQKDVERGALLLDVRTPEEFAAGHFVGAKNHPLQQLESSDMPSTDKSAKIYVYCRSGNRSSQATTILKNAGFTNVTDLGGLSDVQSRGGTLVQ